MSVELKRKLQTMENSDFEVFISDLWSRRGWATEVTPKSKDGGVDVIAEKEFPYNRRLVIQAKRYAEGNSVGGAIVRECAAQSLHNDIDEVVLATTSQFTRNAVEVADDMNVKLVDISTLSEIIRTSNAFDLVDEFSGEVSARSKVKNKLGIRIEDGNLMPDTEGNKSGAQYLRELVLFLYNNDYITEDDIPYSMGPKRFLINSEPVHKDPDNKMKDGNEVTPNVWVEANLSNEQKWRIMNDLAEEFLFL